MAQRFLDSFDHYVDTDLLAKWTGKLNADTFDTGFNGSALHLVYDGRYVYKTLDAQPTWIIGCRMKFSQTATAVPFLTLFDGVGSTQVDLRLDGTRHIYVTRNGTTLGSAGATALTLDTWYYIEFKATIHDSTGIAVVRIDEVTEINLSSQDTKATSNATADTFQIGASVSFTSHAYFDDFYALDGTGGVDDDFWGAVRIESRLPDGNGNYSQLVGSDGNSVNNYLLTDEASPNGDTDYVESSTVSDKDTYTYQNLATALGTVKGVQVLPYAKKTDAGTRSIVSVARLSGTDEDGPVRTLTSSYQYLPDMRPTKPGGGAWTISDINSAEFGVKVDA